MASEMLYYKKFFKLFLVADKPEFYLFVERRSERLDRSFVSEISLRLTLATDGSWTFSGGKL